MPAQTSPNVVVVLADDLAVWALGCYGNREIRTPHLDELAGDGVRFTNFFCTSPVCSPSRASLLTGKMPSQHGVHDWIRGGNGGVDRPINYLDGHRAYTEILAEHGYTCGISGKWHLGNSPQPQKGHSHWFVHGSGGSRYNDVPMYRDGRRVDTSGYLSDVITDDAIGFISRQTASGSPFHLSVNFTAPHSPWVDQHPQVYVDLYDGCAFESCPQETRHPWMHSHPIELDYTEQHAAPERTKVTIRDHLQGYFAAVTALDACVGRLRTALRDLRIEEQTLFVFTSDNGFNCGHHGIWGKGNATFPQNMYDSSVKVPLIVAHPGTIAPDRVSDTMLSGYDFMPTLLDFLAIDVAVDARLPGESFLGELDGRSMDRQDREVVVYDEFGPTRMIRTHEWKYVHRYPHGPHELFDLRHDPGERVNLLVDERVWRADEEDRSRLASDLQSRLERWFARYTDPEVDGRLQAVTGRGQIDLVGPERQGAASFHGMESRKKMEEPGRGTPNERHRGAR
jgi:choline-sulfatase